MHDTLGHLTGIIPAGICLAPVILCFAALKLTGQYDQEGTEHAEEAQDKS